MKKRVLALCLASFFSVNAFALVPPGNDVTTKPDLYYLTNAQAIDSLALLPPPPAVGSIAFLNDQAMYEQGRLLRNTGAGSWRQRMPTSARAAWPTPSPAPLVRRSPRKTRRSFTNC